MPTTTDAELLVLFSAKHTVAEPASRNADSSILTFDAAAAQMPAHAQLLLRALQLQPHSTAHYHQLALLAARSSPPAGAESAYHAAQSVLLERAVALMPSDTVLKFAVSDVRKMHFSLINTAVPGSPHYSNEATHRHARNQWLKSLRDVAAIDEGRYSSTVNQNLGTVLQLMGLYRESAERFVTALELLGLSLRSGLARRELTDGERLNAKILLAGLDLSLGHCGMAREPGHRLGVNLGFWARPDQRPPTNRPGLCACAFYRKEHYHHIVQPFEAAARLIRQDMMALLRRRASANDGEATMWYTDQERIAKRPSQWLRRHVVCSQRKKRHDTPNTCEAVERAMLWYWGAATSLDADAEVDPFYLRAQLSILAPGAHIIPHVGPTNERLALSVGLAGLGLAEIRVGGTWRKWGVGEAIVFDDSFEHEVRNNGSAHPRAVLIVHFPHPQLMPPGSNGARLAEDMASNCLENRAQIEHTSSTHRDRRAHDVMRVQ